MVGPDGRIAVVRQQGGSWSLPKGRIEAGEEPLAAARREVREETGLTDVTLVADLPVFDRSGDNSPHIVKTMILYLFRTQEIVLAPQDPDNPVAEWLPPREAVERLTHPRDREFLTETIRAHGLDDA